MSPPDGAVEIRRIVSTSVDLRVDDTWPEPDMRLVEDERVPAPALDEDVLPANWGRWIADEANARGCPRDYVAAGLIGAGSEWIGNARHVAPTATWTEPPHLWIALIGAPSTGKSPALRSIVDAMRAIEREAEPAWRDACSRHAAVAEGAQAIEERWRESVRQAINQGAVPPDRPVGAEAPPVPPMPRLMAMDATTEELQRLLAGQPRGLLYIRDELIGWLGNHDRYGGRGADRAFFIEAWNGGAYVADRVKNHGAPVRIDRVSLAILGGLQPDRLREVLEGKDDGLTARFLYVWPEPPPILPLSDDDPAAAARQQRLISAAQRLFGLATDKTRSSEPAPGILQLDVDGFRLFDELRQEAMRRAQTSRGLAAGWHGKTPGRALRLALVFEMLAWAAEGGREPNTVSADAMARAGGYLDYAALMLDRVTAGLAVGPVEADTAVIAQHIVRRRGASLNERLLYQSQGMAWLRDARRRGDALRELADNDWIRPAAAGSKGRPRGDWDVNPRIWESRQ